MLKNIKKSLKYFIIVLGVIIMLPTVFYLALQVPEVQTFMVKRITQHISGNINSVISVGKIKYKFFNNLSLSDLLIKDQNNDTLLFVPALTTSIRKLDFKNKSFRLGRVTLSKPVVKFITDSAGVSNLNWYLDKLKGKPDTTSSSNSSIRIDQVDLSDARFSLIDMTSSPGKTKINFGNLNFSGINGMVEDLKILNDTTSFTIYNLALRESSGFNIKRLSTSASFYNSNMVFNSLFINCDSSVLNMQKLAFYPDSANSFDKFTEQVRIELQFDKSLINTTEIGYFVNLPDELNQTVWFSGRLFGTIAELRGRKIDLTYGNYTNLQCDFDISGLPKLENAYMYIGVNSLKTNAKDFERIKYSEKERLVIPDILYKLGNISFDGSFTGFTADFVTYGKLRTSLGSVSTDISLRPEKSKPYIVKGLIKGTDIDLGTLLDNKELLGRLSMQANIDGNADSFKKFSGNITGTIDSIELNNYNLQECFIEWNLH